MQNTNADTAPLEKAIIQQVEEYYQELRAILTSSQNYEKDISIQKVEHLLQFLEYAYERPANRICHIDGLLRDPEGLMVNKMYPFAHLRDSTGKRIKKIAEQSAKLVQCHETLFPMTDTFLQQESHEVELLV
ncbi:MAG: hypothetical protein AAFP19_18735 [Bacteroidota bacterium]